MLKLCLFNFWRDVKSTTLVGVPAPGPDVATCLATRRSTQPFIPAG